MVVHLGCSGWYYWRWKGGFYPVDLPTHQWFRRYARAFKTVEMNSTFYHWPRPATIRGWAQQAPASFRYAIKVNRQITHERRMKNTKRLIQKFSQIADLLGPKFGCFLFQFPPSFRYTAARLKAILAQLDGARANAVEFRHPSWWRQTVYRSFTRAHLIFCSVSAPRLPDDLVKTGRAIYVRFHGKSRWYKYDYSNAELAGWAARIRKSRAQEAWIYFNNDQNGCAVRNARQLARALAAG
jgi:uncharacterized protein YecE (DUF72 family)